MADINIQKKEGGGTPIWLWLLGALLLLALLWFLLRGCENEPEVVAPVADTTAQVAPVETDYTEFDTMAETDYTAGRNVMMSGVVESVPFDEAFFLRTASNRVVLVRMTPTGTESNIDVNRGDSISVRGTTEDLPEADYSRYMTGGNYSTPSGATDVRNLVIAVPSQNVMKMGASGSM